MNEHDLEARHYWLVTEGRDRLARVLGDPGGYDVQVAGWWVWGICAWIGSGWCGGLGPWVWTGEEWTKPRDAGRGISRQRPHLSTAGQGINRQLPHPTAEWFAALAERLRGVRVAHGDWSRVCGPSVTWRLGVTGVFLDPPYSTAERTAGLYATDCGAVAALARAWAIEHGDNPALRICLAGYDGEHAMPDSWHTVRWKADGGYAQGAGRGRDNAARETLWFSPHCINPEAARAPDLLTAAE